MTIEDEYYVLIILNTKEKGMYSTYIRDKTMFCSPKGVTKDIRQALKFGSIMAARLYKGMKKLEGFIPLYVKNTITF